MAIAMTTTSDKRSAAVQQAAELYQEGVESLHTGNPSRAIQLFKDAVERDRHPLYLSHLAFCIAQYQHEYHASVLLCQEAVKKDPKNAVHFLRLGTVHLLAGRKKEAIRILNLGLRLGKNAEIKTALRSLGVRNRPVLPFLARSNPLNKYLGILRSRMASAH